MTPELGLTQHVGGEALLQPLGVHVPLAHDGAGVIDLHTRGQYFSLDNTFNRSFISENKGGEGETHQDVQGLVFPLEGLGEVPHLLGLRQVQDVDVDLL